MSDVFVSDANARVCSEHFTREDYIQPVISGFGPSKPTLKPDAIPSVFSYSSEPKHHRSSELRAEKKDRDDLLSSLLSEPSKSDPETLPTESESSSAWEDLSSEPKTKDVGVVQCGLHVLKISYFR